MGKEQKKGESGIAANYITRTRAVRKLQISLKDFRRLCILKGIYPRDPKKKKYGRDKVYYHIKDINFLKHEPLLEKFRALKVHLKKIKRAKERDEKDRLAVLRQHRPTYQLNHLVKERYPSFIDAVRDIDDALSTVFLFAHLPVKTTVKFFDSKVAESCHRIVNEWQNYVFMTNSLRKVFVSIKGYYYQADIAGQSVTWLVPHAFSQHTPRDVDYRVMVTFLEFYQCLLKFVMFKLYYDLGLRYPPIMDAAQDSKGLSLTALKFEKLANASASASSSASSSTTVVKSELKDATKQIQGVINKIAKKANQDKKKSDSNVEINVVEDGDDANDMDKFAQLEQQQLKQEKEKEAKIKIKQEQTDEDSSSSSAKAQEKEDDDDEVVEGESKVKSEEGVAVPNSTTTLVSNEHWEDEQVVKNLFKGLVIFISRELPQDHIEFVLRSGGARVIRENIAELVGEDGKAVDPYASARDPSITHVVMDRPKVPEYLATPAAVKQEQGQEEKKTVSREYVQPQWIFDSFNSRALLPTYPYAPGVVPPAHLSPFVDDMKEGYIPRQRLILQQWGAKTNFPTDSLKDMKSAPEVNIKKEDNKGENDEEPERDENGEIIVIEGEDDEEEEEELDLEADSDEEDYAKKLQSEKKQKEQGGAAAPAKKAGTAASKKRKAKPNEEEEELERAKIMMKKKDARLYNRIQYGLAKKSAAVQQLENRREQIDKHGLDDVALPGDKADDDGEEAEPVEEKQPMEEEPQVKPEEESAQPAKKAAGKKASKKKGKSPAPQKQKQAAGKKQSGRPAKKQRL